MYSSKEILERMYKNLKEDTDKSENSIVHDVLSPSAIEMDMLHGRVDLLNDNLDVDNKHGEELDKWVFQRIGEERYPSRASNGLVTVEVSKKVVIPKDTIFLADEVEFKALKDTVLNETGDIEVECTQEGTIGNVNAKTINKLKKKIDGVVRVYNQINFTNGTDEETDDAYRERYYKRHRNPAKAGNEAHYEKWAMEVEGVGQVKAYGRTPEILHVTLYLVDNVGRPATEELQKKVFDYIETQRPFGATVHIHGADSKDINIDISVSLDAGYMLEDIEGDIEKAIQKYFKEISFEVGYISIAKITQAILNIEGVLDLHEIKLNGEHKNIDISETEVATISNLEVKEV